MADGKAKRGRIDSIKMGRVPHTASVGFSYTRPDGTIVSGYLNQDGAGPIIRRRNGRTVKD
jgi:hypothetical protein